MLKANIGYNKFHNHYLDPVFFSSTYISPAVINFLILSSGEQKWVFRGLYCPKQECGNGFKDIQSESSKKAGKHSYKNCIQFLNFCNFSILSILAITCLFFHYDCRKDQSGMRAAKKMGYHCTASFVYRSECWPHQSDDIKTLVENKLINPEETDKS